MILLALAEFWNNVIAVGGFILTAVGFVVTVLSLIYAIRQIKETKSAATAARDAATAALAESRRYFQRYVAANCHRYVHEVIIHVENKEWHLAALRLDDLADQVAQLSSEDHAWQRFVDELRTWRALLK
jgi:hypothetical protein